MKRSYLYLLPLIILLSSCGMRAANSIQHDSLNTNLPMPKESATRNKQDAEHEADPNPHTIDNDEQKSERDLGKGSDKEPMPSD